MRDLRKLSIVSSRFPSLEPKSARSEISEDFPRRIHVEKVKIHGYKTAASLQYTVLRGLHVFFPSLIVFFLPVENSGGGGWG